VVTWSRPHSAVPKRGAWACPGMGVRSHQQPMGSSWTHDAVNQGRDQVRRCQPRSGVSQWPPAKPVVMRQVWGEAGRSIRVLVWVWISGAHGQAQPWLRHSWCRSSRWSQAWECQLKSSSHRKRGVSPGSGPPAVLSGEGDSPQPSYGWAVPKPWQ